MITDMSAKPRAASVPARLVRLFGGLLLFGFAAALMVRGNLGLDPWDAFHQGLARQLHVSIGTVTVGISALVLLLWIPLRQRPGFGTISNAVLVGIAIDASLAILPVPHHLLLRFAYLATGIVLTAIATGLYVGAAFGPGPRDGLMTGLAAHGIPIAVARTAIELSVLAAGYFLGGSVGIGTVIFAVTIGPLVHYFLPRLSVTRPTGAHHD